MTKSVTIVNTSNWEGEDVELEFYGTDHCKRGEIILKPGESKEIQANFYGKMFINDVAKGHTQPIMKQVAPKVKVKLK